MLVSPRHSAVMLVSPRHSAVMRRSTEPQATAVPCLAKLVGVR
jgi:hypothetical protein